MTKKSDWAERFALKRRAIDRALLQEAEKHIAIEEARQATTLPPEPRISFSGLTYQTEREEARAAIARAFGRPLR